MKLRFAWMPVNGVYDTGNMMYRVIYWLQEYEHHTGYNEAKRLGLFSYRGKCFAVGRLRGD